MEVGCNALPLPPVPSPSLLFSNPRVPLNSSVSQLLQALLSSVPRLYFKLESGLIGRELPQQQAHKRKSVGEASGVGSEDCWGQAHRAACVAMEGLQGKWGWLRCGKAAGDGGSMGDGGVGVMEGP